MSRLSGAVLVLLLAVFLIPETPLAGQSVNRQAKRLYEKASKTRDVKAKIKALNNALEYDPDYLPALHLLGRTFRMQRNYRLAQDFLEKAADVPARDPMRFQVLSDLAATYNRLGKNAEYEETLRSMLNLKADNEARAQVCFELGRYLYQSNRFQEALSQINSGLAFNPGDSGKLNNLLTLTKQAVELEKLYTEAAAKFIQGRYEEARSKLLLYASRRPGDPRVQAKLNEINAKLASQQEDEMTATLYAEAIKAENSDSLEMAEDKFLKLIAMAPDYRDAASRLQVIQKKRIMTRQEEDLRSTYERGLAAMRRQNWSGALTQFEKVRVLDRNFRDVQVKIAESRQGLSRLQQRARVADYYAAGLEALDNNAFYDAESLFNRVVDLDPDYRNVANLVQELQLRKVETTNSNTLAANQPESPIIESLDAESPTTDTEPAADQTNSDVSPDALYAEAARLIVHKDWEQARIVLEMLNQMAPEYRNVQDLLATVNTQVNRADDATTESIGGGPRRMMASFSLFAIIGVVALLILTAYFRLAHRR